MDFFWIASTSPAELLIRPAPNLPRLIRIVAEPLVPIEAADAFHILRVEGWQLDIARG